MIIPEDQGQTISRDMLAHYPYTFEAIIRDVVRVCNEIGNKEDCPFGAAAWDCADAIAERYQLEKKNE